MQEGEKQKKESPFKQPTRVRNELKGALNSQEPYGVPNLANFDIGAYPSQI